MRILFTTLLAALLTATAAPAQDGSGGGSGSDADNGSEEGPADAKATFDQKCSKCHGEDGKAKTKLGKKSHASNFTRAKWQKRTTDDEIIKAITDGIVEKGKRLMPAFKEKLSEEEIRALVTYVRAFGGAARAAHKPAE